jgi:L-lactate dehydrogenase complex protein LldE
MQVALMVPCYIDLFYPEVGVAALELLEKLNVDVVYPFDQTCCGQPMANSGCFEEAQTTEEFFIRNFSRFDHIVTPSGSCTHHLWNKFIPRPIRRSAGRFQPASTIWSNSCTTSCGFVSSLGRSSITRWPSTPVARRSAASAWLPWANECTTPSSPNRRHYWRIFGGTFSVAEEAVAAKMG